jgi:hypothetical protein
MKKNLLTTAVIFLVLSTRAMAAPFPSILPISFETVIERILSLVPAAATLAVAAMFAWAGYIWLTAGDSDEKPVKARAILMSATVGLILLLTARPLLQLLESIFGTRETVIG